ncbi:MAG TPA: right-handed parallel beta-helix repeat-containing protein [Candidatus Eisenbacteria bacterium]|nr:right-handed parallel beta-helix repeat-containing protein [Candidatus Eisenbacteria bacterium]
MNPVSHRRLGRRSFRGVLLLLAAVAGILPAWPAHAARHNVPAQYSTVKAAVAAAANHDTILVAPGTHIGGVFVTGKAVTIASWYATTGDTNYIAQTVIDTVGAGPCNPGDCAGNAVIEFGSTAGGSAVIGLTIRRGEDGIRAHAPLDVAWCRVSSTADGLDYQSGAGGTIRNCVISNNRDDGIDINGRIDLVASDNVLRDNHQDGVEFRLYAYAGPVLNIQFLRNRIVNNGGDGIQLIDYPDASDRVIRLENNYFSGNLDASVGCMPDGQTGETFVGAPIAERVYLTNNTFSGEHYGFVGGANVIALNNIFIGTQASAVRRVGGNSIVAYTMFWNNGIHYEESVVDPAHTTIANPMLTASGGLTSGSPAIDAGTATYLWQGQTVLSLPPSSYTGSAPDLGAYELGGGAPPPPPPPPPPPSNVIDRRVAAGSDDAEESSAGATDPGNSDLELVQDRTTQRVGLRFASLPIPPGTTIAAAWIQFEADEKQSEITNLVIQAQAADHASTFAKVTNNVSGRPRTTASAAWSPPAWTATGQAGAGQRTPDLAAVVQEVVNRPGWTSGNAIAFIITGTGHRTARSFEGRATGAALLHIELGPSGPPPPPPPNTAPVVDAGANQTIALPSDAILDATVTDDNQPVPPALTTTWTATGPAPVSFENPNAVDTRATFTAVGTYWLRLEASDGELGSSDSLQVTVLTAASFLERRVAVGSDDAEESATGAMDLGSSDLELVFDGSNQRVGMRFTNVTIPQGATIAGAWVQFETDEAKSEATSLLIQAQAADHATAFTTAPASISGRARTTASASWNPVPWSVVGEAGPNQRTPDLGALIQEVVSRPGWASGNAIAIIVTGTGRRTASAFEGRAAGAALLHVDLATTGAAASSAAPAVAASLDLPPAELSLRVMNPAPERGALRIELALPGDAPATLELIDVTGRRVRAHALTSLRAGRHTLDLREGLAAGVYLVRVTQGSARRIAKAVVLR